MPDEILLGTSGEFYKTQDSGEETWNNAIAGGIFTVPIVHDPYTYTDGMVRYFGFNPARNPSSSQGEAKVYLPIDCTIKMALLTWYASNSITNEAISIYVRVNETTDYLIATVSSTDEIKVFSNTAMEVPLTVGDYFEVKVICPTWVDAGGDTVISGLLFVVF